MSIVSGTDIVHEEFLLALKYSKKVKTVSIRLSEPDYKSLLNIAEKYGISTSTLLRCWIGSFIDFEEHQMQNNENI